MLNLPATPLPGFDGNTTSGPVNMFIDTIYHMTQKIALNLWISHKNTYRYPLPAPRWGGAYSAPPPSRIFAITWELRKISPPNFQYLIGHQFDTLSENVVKFGWKFLRKWRFSDVMSCDFEQKMVISYIDRRSMYAQANRKQNVFKQRKLNSPQDGYFGFSIFLFWPPTFQKTTFSIKSALKSKIFKIFKKPYYMYRIHIRVVSMPTFKFVSQFLTPKWL